MIRKAEMPKTTLLISVCLGRASPLLVDGTRKGAINSIFRVSKIQYQDWFIRYKMRMFCTLSERQEVGSKIGFLIADAEFGSDLQSMRINGSRGEVQQICYLFCGLAIPYEGSDLHL